MQLLDLPTELHLHIFSFLGPESLIIASLVCSRCNLLANDINLWRNLYIKKFDAGNLGCCNKVVDWKSLFKKTNTLAKNVKALQSSLDRCKKYVFFTTLVEMSVMPLDFVPSTESLAQWLAIRKRNSTLPSVSPLDAPTAAKWLEFHLKQRRFRQHKHILHLFWGAMIPQAPAIPAQVYLVKNFVDLDTAVVAFHAHIPALVLLQIEDYD